MKKIFLISFLAACTLLSCQPEKKDKSQELAKGGVYYGGVFRINEVQDFRSLYPLSITEVIGHRITNQVYEGLVKYNQKDLSIIPSLAESWEINEDATKFTFKLRKGVRFHDNECFEGGKGKKRSYCK